MGKETTYIRYDALTCELYLSACPNIGWLNDALERGGLFYIGEM